MATDDHPFIGQAEVFETARRMLRDHGRDAILVAAMKADVMRRQGNLWGYEIMKRVMLVVDDMEVAGPAGPPPAH